jgi:death-on-curing protein
VTNWAWIGRDVILAIHDEQLAEHGGASGLRDGGGLESALARPISQAAYGEPDAAALAAAYTFGIARNHPFVDGNKRTAYVAAELFVALNGFDLVTSNEAAVKFMLRLAAGELSEAEFAVWIREYIQPR